MKALPIHARSCSSSSSSTIHCSSYDGSSSTVVVEVCTAVATALHCSHASVKTTRTTRKSSCRTIDKQQAEVQHTCSVLVSTSCSKQYAVCSILRKPYKNVKIHNQPTAKNEKKKSEKKKKKKKVQPPLARGQTGTRYAFIRTKYNTSRHLRCQNNNFAKKP